MNIGTARVEPGEVSRGWLDVADLPTGGTERLPIMIVAGDSEGPTLWVTASLHGNEVTPLAVAQALVRSLSPTDLRGTLVSVPTINPAGLRLTKRRSYYHRDDPNRYFPALDREGIPENEERQSSTFDPTSRSPVHVPLADRETVSSQPIEVARMKGKTVVVTGASRGLGESVARAFAREGAHVVCCARSEDALKSVAAEIDADGGTVTAQRADVRDEFDVERLMETAARVGGREIDVVVANAGVYHGDPGETYLKDEAYAAVDDHLRTNARGVYTTIKEAIPHLAENARILVPSGSIAREAEAGFGSYAVSKAAAEAVVRGFAAELDQCVGILDPGQVETGLGVPGRDPDEVSELFVWAATDLSGQKLDGPVVDLRAWRKATR